MEIALIANWRLTFTPEEFRLVQKALRCALTEEEKVEAIALQEKLIENRATQARHFLNEMEKPLKQK